MNRRRSDALETRENVDDERMALGKREIYVALSDADQGAVEAAHPGGATGTARNMNTVAKLAELAREIA